MVKPLVMGIIGGVIGSIVIISVFAYFQLGADDIKLSKQTTYKIGDVVTLDGISYMVTDSPTRTTGDTSKKPDGIYYRIPLKMENLDKQQKLVFNDQFTLIDSKNREYKTAEYWFSYTKDLVGGEGLSFNFPIERGIYFDIPYDEELQYKLKIKPWGKISFSYEIICVENC